MIRAATLDDLPALSRVGRLFYEEAGLPGEYREERFVQSWANILGQGLGVILMAEGDEGPVGAVGAFLLPDIYTEDLIADEAFWFIDKDHRGGTLALRLFSALEKWAYEMGADRQNFVHLEKLQPARLKRLYEKKGYQVIQTLYQREVA